MAYKITFIPGDGIGPEVMKAAKRVIKASGVSIDFEEVEAGEKLIEKYGTPLPGKALDTIAKNKIAWKGPITTPVGKGFRSVNVALRQKFNLYANLRPIKTYEGVPSRYENIDLLIVRENTEDLYAGIEHMVGEDAAESIKIITRKASEKIVQFAFNTAIEQGRKKVTAVHKANIMKCTDGLFLNVAREIAKNYPDILFEEIIVDAMSMKLVMNPEKYDVLVMPNLYGDILSDMAAGLVGGLGLAPGANIGDQVAIFEAIHGSAPDIAGKNIANPTAAILSGVMMLQFLGEYQAANKIEQAVAKVLKQRTKTTCDLGGNSSTTEFTQAVIHALA
ncbi:isocitrate/isopropylmalate dehydrogenase family protein [Garciella nitratireducens]|uniref:isocitrate/isopropylmalate dehydrogenase family protein n=1 Tax=Garciella nitratireducens TaxID=218205 RepID=UPI000DEB80B6|nr:isocitrate/isopropylmalate dehydrogenase family protein [Garciella nitratireducens]RBP37046.1 isocitrate dehydrogenase (NAD+) [Garciella nitratireducens]